MGVEFKGRDEPDRFEGMSYDERQALLRRERAERLREHAARQKAFIAESDAEAESDAPVKEHKDLGALTKEALAELAARQGLDVERADGRTDIGPTRADYLAALGG